MNTDTVHFQHVKCLDCPQHTWCSADELGTEDQRCTYCYGSYHRWRLAA